MWGQRSCEKWVSSQSKKTRGFGRVWFNLRCPITLVRDYCSPCGATPTCQAPTQCQPPDCSVFVIVQS